MVTFLLIFMAGMAVLAVFEFVRKRLHLSNEDSRKAYHIVHGILVAVAPFLISYRAIIVFEVLLLVEMIAVKRFNLLPWVYKVGRVSWGEYFGVVAVILIALMEPNKWVFLAAMLHLGIADALAALIGKRYGKHYQFKFFGQKKSVPGSLAFLITSIVLTTVVIVASGDVAGSWMLLILLPPLATLAEAASPYGSDNFILPVLVVLVLNSLQFAA